MSLATGRHAGCMRHLRPPVRLLVKALLLARPPPLLPTSPEPWKPLNPRLLPGVDEPAAGEGDDCALSIRFLPSVLLRRLSRGEAASSADRLLFVGEEVGLQRRQRSGKHPPGTRSAAAADGKTGGGIATGLERRRNDKAPVAIAEQATRQNGQQGPAGRDMPTSAVRQSSAQNGAEGSMAHTAGEHVFLDGSAIGCKYGHVPNVPVLGVWHRLRQDRLISDGGSGARSCARQHAASAETRDRLARRRGRVIVSHRAARDLVAAQQLTVSSGRFGSANNTRSGLLRRSWHPLTSQRWGRSLRLDACETACCTRRPRRGGSCSAVAGH